MGKKGKKATPRYVAEPFASLHCIDKGFGGICAILSGGNPPRYETNHNRFEVLSAGLVPTQVHPLTRQVLAETGLDPSALRAKGLNDVLGRVRIHYAIIVCDRAEEHCPRLYPFARQTLYWPFDDPTHAAESTGEQLRLFRTVRDQIAHRVRAWLFTLEDSA